MAALILCLPARAAAHPPTWFVAQALCVHSGYMYTPRRVPGRPPGYVLWRHGYWRLSKTWSNGEGAWTATSNPLYGGGLSFTVGTWNSAGGHARSTADIAAAPPAVQIARAWVVVSRDRSWREWPVTSRACGLR